MAEWNRVKEILDAALDVPAGDRAGYLARSCAGDEALYREVLALLELEDASGEFLSEPIFSLHGAPEVDPNVGRLVGPFRLRERLPGGGMGAVYLAERAQGDFTQRAAVKLIKRGMDSEEIVRRFQIERSILAQLGHDAIARLLDGGTTDEGLPFFALEFVDGMPLDQYCDEKRLTVRERIALFLRVCDAVAFAHRNLVVHRDLKPGNVLVTAAGNPKLLDFGIAKLLAPEGAGPGAATVVGTVPLTPGYASPEQVRGEAISTATDIYSLGVILYELLTGRRPFQLDTWSIAAWRAVLEVHAPTRPSSAVVPREAPPGQPPAATTALAGQRQTDPEHLRRTLRGDLDRIVLKAMAKDPAERYGTVAELATDLRLYLAGQPVRARAQTWRYRTGKFLRRHAASASVAGAFLALLIAFAVNMAVQRQQLAAEKKRVTAERDRAQAVEKFLIEDVFRVATPGDAERITARQILDTGAKGLDDNQDLPTATLATLLDATGRVYLGLGLRDEAVPRLERALELRRGLQPADELAVAESLNNLSGPVRKRGEIDRAELLLREAAAIQRAARGRGEGDPVVLGTTLANLGALLQDRGKTDEARALYEEAIALKRSVLADDSPEVARTRNLLATLLLERGDYAHAEPLLRSVLAVRRQQEGRNADEELATSLNNLALACWEQGKLAEAESLHREDMALRQRIYATVPAKLGLGLLTEGVLAASQGHAEAAQEALREALAIYQGGPAKVPTSAAHVNRHLAALYTAHPELGGCEAPARAAWATNQERRKQAWQTADAESVLGGCLAALGRADEAEPLLRESYAQLRALTRRRPYLPEARQRLADFYRRQGRSAEAAAVAAERDPAPPQAAATR